MPSQYEDRMAEEIWYDVTYRLRVRLGEVTINHLQSHYSMVKILSQAFGSNKLTDGVKVNDMQPEQAVSALNNFFAGKGS